MSLPHSSSSAKNTFPFSMDDVENEYDKIEFNEEIEKSSISILLERMSQVHYAASNDFEDALIYSRCKKLFANDFVCEIIDNSTGSLCPSYPARVIIPVDVKRKPEKKRSSLGSKNEPDVVDGPLIQFNAKDYREKVKQSYGSRCRSRFAVPAILFEKTFICRSGTLSVRKGAAYASMLQPDEPCDEYVCEEGLFAASDRFLRNIGNMATRTIMCTATAATQMMAPDTMQRLREADVKVLKSLGIQYICDFMVEDRKTSMFITVSSSEKINMDTYSEFKVEQMPYPGCEFFKSYSDAERNPSGLVFDWNMVDVNAELKLTEEPSPIPSIEWSKYKEWDLVELTQNYLAQILEYIQTGKGSILIHCISGWDRTPLFISLVRLSLWADGLIHQSLSDLEMAYFTLAYDWYLFGHNLPDRLSKGEEVMHFCFKFLPYITQDFYSLNRLGLSGDETTEETNREKKLKSISTLVLSLYKDLFINNDQTSANQSK